MHQEQAAARLSVGAGRGRDGGRSFPGGRVRDSKVPSGPALTFEVDSWATFIGELKTGQRRV
ncbi:DUF397 domain-containing protein [Streptomyces sp. NPDC002088]|uniref:DUF397 domain-containing protein n=1 Tax=Streptomyces sp. NPDC002088 TaxID=3154665 RepID=UPI00332A9F66